MNINEYSVSLHIQEVQILKHKKLMTIILYSFLSYISDKATLYRLNDRWLYIKIPTLDDMISTEETQIIRSLLSKTTTNR